MALTVGVALVAVGAAGSAEIPAQSSTPAAQAQLAAASTQKLGLALLTDAAGSGNAVISPFSVEEALAMVDQGAAGVTARQIGTVLGAPDAQALAASTRALLAYLATVSSTAGDGTRTPLLTNANSLWLASSLGLDAPFLTTLSTEFGAAPHRVDFATAPDSARQTINSWVSEHTAGKIGDLFPQGSVTKATLLVLANAIYLKARWLKPFDPSQTRPGPFHLASGASQSVEFMTTDDPIDVPWTRTSADEAVELPYRGTSLSLLAVMPTSRSLRAFLATLTPAQLTQIAASLRASPSIDVTFPRLDLDFASDLVNDLSSLGMPAAFNAPGFTAIVPHTPVVISTVRHEATFKVTEAGTIAAAATGVGVVGLAYPGPILRITFNRPFLLFLRDGTTGALLFAAAISDPSET